MICASRNLDHLPDETPLDSRDLHGTIKLQPGAFGLAALFYRDGASRRAAVQAAIADALSALGLAVCIVDLLDPEEAEDAVVSGQVSLLAKRMDSALDVIAQRADTRKLPIALISADESVAAAMAIAGIRPGQIGTVVGCYGRPDLAPVDLGSITVPTLLVVPSKERQLVACNERVFEVLNCPSQLAVIVGASRGFTEPGTRVACEYVVGQWCERHLRAAAGTSRARC
ncbi:MAG TPA: hypothetical protein VJ783_11200 [Pirellulales bacterium]|nr:hypothetical protein [Pirellulales bacterium]